MPPRTRRALRGHFIMDDVRNPHEDWSGGDPPENTLDEKFVKWIPIVVPLMALFLGVMVLFIAADVL